MTSLEIRWMFNALTWNPSKRQLLQALSSISNDERDRIFKFMFQEDYKLSLCGRIMIRKCISKTCNWPWSKVELTRSAKGKPLLADDVPGFPAFSFNVSHQGEFTVLAASTCGKIGVDIMKVVRPSNSSVPAFFQLMRRQFADSEWHFIKSFDTEISQLAAFYRLWCLKESFVKATGDGIGVMSADYLHFDVATANLSKEQIVTDSVLYVRNVRSTWHFEEQMLDADHMVAVASAHVPKTPLSGCRGVAFQLLTDDELLEGAEPLSAAQDCWWDEFISKSVKFKCLPKVV